MFLRGGFAVLVVVVAAAPTGATNIAAADPSVRLDRMRFDRNGIRFAYPPSWFVATRPLSDGLDGEYVFTVSTHQVRRTARDQGACLWGIARQLPKDGVLAFLVEANEVERRSLVREFDPRPRTFPLPSRRTGAVCGFPRASGGRGAWIPFQTKGRAFTLAIQIGPRAPRAAVNALQRMLDGMRIAPR